MPTVPIEAIQEIVGRQLGKRGVGPDDELAADLGVESIDILNLVSAVEEKYRINASDEEISRLKTVRDIHALVSGKVP